MYMYLCCWALTTFTSFLYMMMLQITIDILVEMSNEDLQSIGITTFGTRHRILKKIKELLTTPTYSEGIYHLLLRVYPILLKTKVRLIGMMNLTSFFLFVLYYAIAHNSIESPVPVGVVSEKPGSQLIELFPYDKEYIGVSEMVGVAIKYLNQFSKLVVSPICYTLDAKHNL